MGELRVMGTRGDDRIAWDPEDPEQTKKASTRFKELLLKGYRAWKMDESGKKGVPLKEFDPGAGAVLMAAPIAGG